MWLLRIWNDLNGQAQLLKLTEIDYNMLTHSFLDFIKTQATLRELTFYRPLTIILNNGLHQHDDITWM